MALTLHVDAARWREHLRRYVDDAGSPRPASSSSGVTVVPVTKGNGYGFGNTVLATESAKLGASTLAVGTYDEVAAVDAAFSGDVLVLSPWRPSTAVPSDDERIVHTVSRLSDLRRLADGETRPRVVVEVLTSMLRHGIPATELTSIAELLDGVRFEGFALHMPLGADNAAEARTVAERALATLPEGSAGRVLWVSHLSPGGATELARSTSAEVRLRVATALWLGDRGALSAHAAVLDEHAVRRGHTYGYRQRRARKDGTLLVVAGGTAHGIALEAPSPATTTRQRAVALAKGGLESIGRALSPFTVGGKQRWFAEPPHMQCSMIWLPGDVEAPAIGDHIELDVRLTTTTFDDIVWHG